MTMQLRHLLLIGAAALVAQVGVLWLLGQPPICACGYVKLWEGNVRSSGASQHLTDWYSVTHVLHGFAFYLLAWIALPRQPARTRFLLALFAEVGWEILENTPVVIHAYRKQALAQGYFGDSIVNSLSDTLMMSLGFAIAARAPVWSVIALALAMEIGTAYAIRDNLTLNLLNFIHPFEAVRRWQSGG